MKCALLVCFVWLPLLLESTTLKDVKLEDAILKNSGIADLSPPSSSSATSSTPISPETTTRTAPGLQQQTATENLTTSGHNVDLASSAFSSSSSSLGTLPPMVPDRDEDDDEPELDGTAAAQSHNKPGGIFNFASQAAGAVVLGASPAAKNFHYLLDDDMDRYGISPCNEKKWVVIGLSEDILISSVVLANFEKYSSFLKDFQLLASTVYPTEEWINLGTYTALPKLGEQTFNATQTSTYCRYVKFKFLSHYDTESLCTLSQIKVHGTTVIASFKEEVEMSDNHMRTLSFLLTDEAAVAGEEEANSTTTIDAAADALRNATLAAADSAATIQNQVELPPLSPADASSQNIAPSTSPTEAASSNGTFADGVDAAAEVKVEAGDDKSATGPSPPPFSSPSPPADEEDNSKEKDKDKEEKPSSAIGIRIESVVRSVKEIVSPLLTQLKEAKNAVKDASAATTADTFSSLEAEPLGNNATLPLLVSGGTGGDVGEGQQGGTKAASPSSSEALEVLLPSVKTDAPMANATLNAAAMNAASNADLANNATDERQTGVADAGKTADDAKKEAIHTPHSTGSEGGTLGDSMLGETHHPQALSGTESLTETAVESTDDAGGGSHDSQDNSTSVLTGIDEATIISRQIVVVPVMEPHVNASISTACQDIMRFPDFQAKMMAKLQQHEDRTLPMAGAHENVYKRLMTKVNALEKNHTILVLYMSQVSECYRSLVLDKLEGRHARAKEDGGKEKRLMAGLEEWVLLCAGIALVVSLVALMLCGAVFCLVVFPKSTASTQHEAREEVPTQGGGNTTVTEKRISKEVRARRRQ